MSLIDRRIHLAPFHSCSTPVLASVEELQSSAEDQLTPTDTLVRCDHCHERLGWENQELSTAAMVEQQLVYMTTFRDLPGKASKTTRTLSATIETMAESMIDLPSVESELGYKFTDTTNAMVALQPSVQGFSRLEFLGDAILGLVVFTLAEYTHTPRPEASRLVSNDVLDELFHSTFAPHSPANTGDVIEALVGAVYLDGGFDCAASAITTAVTPHLGPFNAMTIASNVGSLSPRGLMHLGASTSRAVVANNLCTGQPKQSHKWFSEERSRLLRNSRLAEISRTRGLCSSELRGNERKDAAATDALDQHIAKQFLTLGWDEAQSPIIKLLALEHEF